MSYTFCDGIAKLIPFQPGKLITLKQARAMEPLLAEREQNEEEVRSLLTLAESLEGLTRNVGMHAGGVLIAPGKLTDFCPLYAPSGSDAAVSQFDKDDVEAIGLVKFDFLGLTTLTILARALDYVRKLDPSSTLTLDDIPLDDKETYKLFQQGHTSAVFQFESRGMRDLLKQARPDRLDDLIALNALYRPGPMDLIPEYCDRKHGRQRVDYLDPRLVPILGPTYGVMVYQEQVMQIAQEIGGYTLGGADLLRRAMGKKKPEEMAKHRDVFVAGAEKNGLSRAKAVALFDLMEKFAGYGFNKSHSAAYALIAYQTAWLKVHHPAAFMAANLSLVMDDTDKVRALRDDALALGLEVLPPDVNASTWRFEPVDPKRIRYGLGGIKGTGQQAVEAIVAARETGGPFRDLADFAARVDKRLVNRRVVESLVKGGAFDAIDKRRATLFASIGNALAEAERALAQAAQNSLFGDAGAAPAHVLVETRDWSDAERLQHEKGALGFYLSGHPYAAYASELAPLVRTSLADIQPRGERFLIAGIVTAQRVQSGRRGKIAFVTLDDGKGSAEIVVFNEVYDASRAMLREDALVVVEVKATTRMTDDGEAQGMRILAEQVHDLAAVRRRWGKRLKLSCNGNASAEHLADILAPFRAEGLPVVVHYGGGAVEGDVELPDAWRVAPDDALIARLADWLAPENVQVLY
jgi:DNA polymerase-3 subunit alpha